MQNGGRGAGQSEETESLLQADRQHEILSRGTKCYKNMDRFLVWVVLGIEPGDLLAHARQVPYQ